MILFTKKGCAKCDWLKKNADLSAIEIADVQEMDGLSKLAWDELVMVAETALPILLIKQGSYLTNAIAIKNYLKNGG